MIGGGIGGFLMGILNVKNYSGGSPGFLTLPSYLGGDTLQSFTFACLGAAVSVVSAFIISYLMFRDPADDIDADSTAVSGTDGAEAAGKRKDANVAVDTEDDAVRKAEVLLSPLEGEVVLLAEVNDPTFAEEILGKGVAVRPVGGRVCAPADGRLVSCLLYTSLVCIGFSY